MTTVYVLQASSVMFLVTATSNLLDATGSLEACIVTAMQADSSGGRGGLIKAPLHQAGLQRERMMYERFSYAHVITIASVAKFCLAGTMLL